MAGIWERIKRDLPESVGRVEAHMLDIVFVLYASGTIPNKQLALAKIAEHLERTEVEPLSFAAQSDLNSIADAYDAAVGLADKLRYLLHVKAAILGAETGVLSEAEFRNLLGI